MRAGKTSMKDYALFGSGLHATSYSISPDNRVNCYFEVRKDDGRIIVRGTPGSAKQWELPVTLIRGWLVVNGVLYVVAGSHLYSVTITGVITHLAVLPTATGKVGMADNYAQICIVDGAGGYVFIIAAGTLTTITDVHFPNGAATVTCINSRFIVEKPSTREFYESDALDGLNWTYISLPIFGTKEQYSDPLSGVGSLNGVLILWGTKSIEFWQDIGSSPQPFGKVQGATQSYGLAARYSIAQINNDLFFLGQGGQGGPSVFAITGYTPTRVSSSDVEDILAGLAANFSLADATAITYSVSGHDFYQITFPAANVTLLYAVDTGIWSRVQSGNAPARHFADQSIQFNKQTLLSDPTSGNVYLLSSLFYTDNGQTIFRQVASREIRNDGMEFAISELELQMDTGSVPLGASYHISMEVSRDKGRTFGSPRSRTLGLIGQYKTPRVKWDRFGSSRTFVLRFSMTDPIPFVIASEAIETTVV